MWALEITMTTRSFTTFAEASAFARNFAREKSASVRIMRRGLEFVVESGVSFDAPAIRQPKSGRTTSAPPPRPPQKPKTSWVPLCVDIPGDARLCIDCGSIIPAERVKAVPSVSRCIKCQSSFEQSHNTRPHIDEGLPGTRDGHKKMRGQLWGDMRNRGRGR